MDKKTRKELLKGWAEHKGFELFMEDIELLLNKNRDSLATLDLFSEKDRAKGVKIQANVNSIIEVCNFINRYKKTARVISQLDTDNL